MHLIASAAVTVDCPCAKTFDFAADLENFGAWFPGVINIVSDSELPFCTVGKRYLETVAIPVQGNRVVSIRVVDVSPPLRIITQGDFPVLLPRMEIECNELAAGTCEVRWRMHSRNDNVFARYTVLPVARQVMRRRASAGLRTLKQMLESGDTSARGSSFIR